VKIRIGHLDEILCEGEATGEDEVKWTGKTDSALNVVDYYASQGLKGEALLRRLVERLRGQWWAEEVSDDDADDVTPAAE
jgi:hypothetical protein